MFVLEVMCYNKKIYVEGKQREEAAFDFVVRLNLVWHQGEHKPWSPVLFRCQRERGQSVIEDMKASGREALLAGGDV